MTPPRSLAPTTPTRLHLRLGLFGAVPLLVTLLACGSSDGSDDDGSGNGQPKNNGPTFVDPNNGNVSPQDVDPGSACATSSAVGTGVPASLVFMFDRSGSMRNDKKWAGASTATKAFFADPASTGLQASLQFFPLYQGGTSENGGTMVCADAIYKVPAVDLRPLPNATDFAQAIDNVGLDENTPTLPALKGALAYAKEIQAQGKKAAVVLVTDGEPNSCNPQSTVKSVSEAAQAEAGAVKTYVIGVGDSLNKLDAVAIAGGTTKAILVSTQDPTKIADDLKKALGVVAAQAMSCDYTIPVPGNGQTIDPNKVNVRRTGGTTAGATLTYNATCNGEGWRYDNVAAPTRILLCAATCDGVMKDPGAKIEVFFGCAVKGGIPR